MYISFHLYLDIHMYRGCGWLWLWWTFPLLFLCQVPHQQPTPECPSRMQRDGPFVASHLPRPPIGLAEDIIAEIVLRSQIGKHNTHCTSRRTSCCYCCQIARVFALASIVVIAGFASLSAVVSLLIMLYGPMLCFVIGFSSLLCAYRFFIHRYMYIYVYV